MREIDGGSLRAKKSLVVDLEVLGDSIMHYLSDQGGPVGMGEKFFIRTTRRGSELCTERDPVHGRALTEADRRKVKALVNLRRRVPGARITSRPVPARS
ncbi:MAG TPA: hypothetical protein VLF20_04530 [Patescibacteria group bacterium]|nr:hypothetical protein [Patescibacteria group bacterium]